MASGGIKTKQFISPLLFYFNRKMDSPISEVKPIHITIGIGFVALSMAFSTGILYNKLDNAITRITNLEDLRKEDQKFHNETIVSLQQLLDFQHRAERMYDKYIRDPNDPDRRIKQ